ncbi:hypothetical protein HRED_01906, partial [Candidatus Haloredivivus sp. G17]
MIKLLRLRRPIVGEIAIKRYFLTLLSILLFISPVMAQTYDFNNCGSLGKNGPSSCSYTGDNSVVINNQGFQKWTVPESGKYRIKAAGAQGAAGDPSYRGGYGALVKGSFNLREGEDIVIAVGQKGTAGSPSTNDNDGGGGGGSFVVSSSDYTSASTSDILVIAGGGAGTRAYVNDNGCPGNEGEYAIEGSGSDQTSSCPVKSTDLGEGGIVSSGSWGSAGGGWGSNGEGDYDTSAGGRSWFNGLEGGHDSESPPAPGGFGAGGSGHGSWGGGGGGGYSGGDGGRVAGGGGSYNTGSDQSNTGGENSGHGYVEIETVAVTSDPTVQSPTYTDSQATSSSPASFEVDAPVDVDTSVDGGNSLSSCSVDVTGDDNGGSYSPSTTVSGDTCEFSVDNNDDSNWEPGETVSVDITATDDLGNTDVGYFTHTFDNTPPTINSVTPSDGASSVWGGENGVSVQADVVDFESVHTNDDLTVDFVDDSLGQFGSVTVSNGDGTASVNWERNGQQDMFGFDRGTSYGWKVNVDDVTASTTTQSQSFTVLSEASTSNPSPTGGDSADQMKVDIDNPAVSNDGSLSGSTVEFWVDDGLEVYQVNTDTVSGSSGTASISLQDFEFRNEPADGTGDWFVKVNDTYSETDYSRSKYGSNTYNFSAAKPPLILSEDPSSYPIAETGVG